ncbi:TrbC/VirB2 family protein [Acidithiobacillus sulfuriphilus]|uniref:TrbC/VirB2 family protein n=1 Tax=Acidithiobacillus sulfuriphilus TaxID=1867749 RepID=UPI003F623353
MMKMKMKMKMKVVRTAARKLGAAIAMTMAPAVAFASTSGGVFSPITGPLNTVLTGMQDMGGLVAAGGVVSTALSWWHGGEHKKAMMIGLGATVGGIAMANAKGLATSITGGATIGHAGIIGLAASHALHVVGL